MIFFFQNKNNDNDNYNNIGNDIGNRNDNNNDNGNDNNNNNGNGNSNDKLITIVRVEIITMGMGFNTNPLLVIPYETIHSNDIATSGTPYIPLEISSYLRYL